MGATGALWRSLGPLNVGWQPAFGFAVIFALLFSLTGAILGINRTSWTRANASDALDLLPPLGAATLLALLLNGRGGLPELPRGLILASAVVASGGLVAARYRSRLITGMLSRWLAWRQHAWAARERMLVIGSGQTGQFTVWMLQNMPASATFRVAGYIDDDFVKQGRRIRGVSILGLSSDIPRLVARHDIGILVFAIHNISPAERRRILGFCAQTPARLIVIPDLLAAVRQVTEQIARQGAPAAGAAREAAGRPGWLPAGQVDAWLAELENLARSGDQPGLRTRLAELRRSFPGDGVPL
jgi:FlaA1/EpsC-like NDP-sugar epimerase